MRPSLAAALLIGALLLPVTGRGEVDGTGLLLHLPLSSDFQDHSPQRHPVAVTNRVEIRDGAAYFPGEGAWLIAPHLPLNGRPFAIAMWVKPTGSRQMFGLIEQHETDRVNRWLHVMLRGGWQPYLGFYVNDTISPASVPVGKWTHLVFQFTGTHQQIWINGQLLCARKAPAYAGTGGMTRIGKSPSWSNVPSHDFEGSLRELRIYGRALATEEILLLTAPPGNLAKNAQVYRGLPGYSVTVPNQSALGWAANAGIPFLAIERNALRLTGEASQIYEIQFTDSLLTPWQPLIRLTNQTGQLNFVDRSAPASGNRFYRVTVRGTR